MAGYTYSVKREKPVTKTTLPSKDLTFDRAIKNFTDRQNKRIQHHHTSFTTNAKGNSLSRKQEKKKTHKNKPKTIKKIVIGTYISITTLNINGLNA